MNISVCHLTCVHYRYDTRIFYKMCRYLSNKNFHVSLIVADGKGHENVNHINIIDSGSKPSNRFCRMIKSPWRVYRIAKRLNCNIYHFHDVELIPIALLLKVKGKKVIYDVHEDVPRQILNRHYIPRFIRSLISPVIYGIEQFGALFFDAIITVTENIARKFPKSKTLIIQNYPIMNELFYEHSLLISKRRPIIAFVGGISEHYGIKEIIESINLLPGESNIKLFLAGRFSHKKLEYEVKRMKGWKRVSYFGWQSREDVAFLLAQSFLGLVLFHPLTNYIVAQPNKLFEYMSAGIPIIASNFPLWRTIVEDSNCGLTVDPLSPSEISKAIQWLLEHPNEAERMGRNGRNAVITKYNWELEFDKLIELYKKWELKFDKTTKYEDYLS